MVGATVARAASGMNGDQGTGCHVSPKVVSQTYQKKKFGTMRVCPGIT